MLRNRKFLTGLFTSKTTPPLCMLEYIGGGVVIGETLMKVYWLHTQRKDGGQYYFMVGFGRAVPRAFFGVSVTPPPPGGIENIYLVKITSIKKV